MSVIRATWMLSPVLKALQKAEANDMHRTAVRNQLLADAAERKTLLSPLHILALCGDGNGDSCPRFEAGAGPSVFSPRVMQRPHVF